MTNLERAWTRSANRRNALRALAGFLAGSPFAYSQQDPFRDHSRVPRLEELVTTFDFEAVAYAKLPRAAYDYTAYGAAGEFTLRRNREAFEWVKLVPNAVMEPGSPNAATEVLGTKMAFPILISPTSGHAQLHPEGELETYRGATAASQTPMIVSNVSSFPFEKIAPAATGPLWFQLYPRPELEANREVLDRVQAAGCKAVVVTVDQQASYYERALHYRNLGGTFNRRPPRRAEGGNPYDVPETRLWYDWKLFDQLRPIVKVPMVIKGVLTAEDARLSLDHGLDAVYVSNHGGRSLDYGPSTLEVLPEIVDAVQGRVPVLFDSGIRRGADILKALALGANAVCLGRAPRWGVGSYGAAGVQRILEILQAEFVQAMASTGRQTLASINRAMARTDFP
jgi:4-hydroxymandelate oxidase